MAAPRRAWSYSWTQISSVFLGSVDWPGITIGTRVMRIWHATPWQFGTGDHLGTVPRTSERPRDLDIGGVEAIWDTGLATAMRERELAIAEEAVARRLIDAFRC